MKPRPNPWSPESRLTDPHYLRPDLHVLEGDVPSTTLAGLSGHEGTSAAAALAQTVFENDTPAQAVAWLRTGD